MLKQVVDMSHQAGIPLLSIAADGARSEFNAQVKLMNNGENYFKFNDSLYNIQFKSAMCYDKPIIRMQCPKHAKKTARNQLFSGARFITLGKQPVFFGQLAKLVNEFNTCLLKRDVFNTDRQDDGAAFRIFCSNFLAQLTEHERIHEEYLSLFVYLFILGELFDAFLNREINHAVRIKMVMRSYFFLNIWLDYINQCIRQHSKQFFSAAKSFISSQSYDIFQSLSESMVLLILAHRDYFANFPFIPWEFGTEALEHLFGISRQLVEDFSFYEFYKILRRVLHRDKILRTSQINIKEQKTSANGNKYRLLH
jgi:hypothetical protein